VKVIVKKSVAPFLSGHGVQLVTSQCFLTYNAKMHPCSIYTVQYSDKIIHPKYGNSQSRKVSFNTSGYITYGHQIK